MKNSLFVLALVMAAVVFGGTAFTQVIAQDDSAQNEKQLAKWLKRFPQADTNRDGKLTNAEANAFRKKLQSANAKKKAISTSDGPKIKIDSGWDADKFPDHAVCYCNPEEIAEIYLKSQKGKNSKIPSYEKPEDGSLRIVGTGHSFMRPGFQTFPVIAKAAGLQQPPLVTNTGGGVTGSARYKWEQENGIFDFDGKPSPKLLASISNSQWDAMMWGPYYQDRPEFYSCWIDFCLKYNPDMKFYLMNAWPQLEQFDERPKSDAELTSDVLRKMAGERQKTFNSIVEDLNAKYSGKVHVLPTCEAMLLAVEHFHRGELPGVEGIHRLVGKKERSLWNDMIGHLGPGFANLEGYVFYATIYGRSPELIDRKIQFGGNRNYPDEDLDRVFRKIAWQAVLENSLTGIVDENSNGISDDRE